MTGRHPAAEDVVWHRLSPRMLLVHPVHEVLRQLPVLLGTLVLGTATGNNMVAVVVLALTVGFGVARWFTTSYCIGPSELQLRTGVLQRKVLSVPRNRIRSVSTDARLLHRVLGLTVMRVSTGQEAKHDSVFALDAVQAEQVPGCVPCCWPSRWHLPTTFNLATRAGCWRGGSRPGCATAR